MTSSFFNLLILLPCVRAEDSLGFFEKTQTGDAGAHLPSLISVTRPNSVPTCIMVMYPHPSCRNPIFLLSLYWATRKKLTHMHALPPWVCMRVSFLRGG